MSMRTRGVFLSRLASSGLRSLPAFVIIGGMKCGTTSIYKYLVQHPSVEKGFMEEVHYFDLNYHRGLSWYRAHFPKKGKDSPIAGDDSPYYLFHPLVPERVARDLPEAKLIVLLRNPVDRAFSHYNHELKRGRETLSFPEALEREDERLEGEVDRMEADGEYNSHNHQRFSYTARGRYAEQLERWFSVIPRERFLIMQSEEMFRDPASALAITLDFLDLPPLESPSFPVHNPGGYSSSIDPGTRSRLEEHFRPLNQELYRLLGRSFDW
ncbi:MAG: sulfotransferase domain-containing protein [Thermoplasmata archaeon]|nr:MAG: sulfotransferase domain-containing protein [Thermoplasmata archaeon]